MSNEDPLNRLEWLIQQCFTNGADGSAFIMQHAADEIKRLRSIIKVFHFAEREYMDAMNDPYDGGNNEVVLKKEWKDAWQALEDEAEAINNSYS